MTPTSSTLVAEVGEPPDVAQAHSEADAGEEEVHPAGPRAAVPLLAILGQAGARAHAGVRAGHGGGEADDSALLRLQQPQQNGTVSLLASRLYSTHRPVLVACPYYVSPIPYITTMLEACPE